MPPPIKVFEAIGAIGDGRVRALDETTPPTAWEVASSDGTKRYRVEVSADGREISSNDNASYWQGYLGYPAIAVLMARGTLHASAEAIRALAGIPWKKLNRRFKNDYARRPPRSRASWPSAEATSMRLLPKPRRFSTRWPRSLWSAARAAARRRSFKLSLSKERS